MASDNCMVTEIIYAFSRVAPVHFHANDMGRFQVTLFAWATVVQDSHVATFALQ
jgi:hypothetical protein